MRFYKRIDRLSLVRVEIAFRLKTIFLLHLKGRSPCSKTTGNMHIIIPFYNLYFFSSSCLCFLFPDYQLLLRYWLVVVALSLCMSLLTTFSFLFPAGSSDLRVGSPEFRNPSFFFSLSSFPPGAGMRVSHSYGAKQEFRCMGHGTCIWSYLTSVFLD